MVDPQSGDLLQARRAATENARRQARFLAAEERIRRIVDAAPPFTPEQVDKLVTLLRAS